MRIYKRITEEEMLVSKRVLKNNIEFSLLGQFSVPLSFLNLPIIISLLTQLRVKLALQVYKNGRHELLNKVEELREWFTRTFLTGFSKSYLELFSRATCTRIQTNF